MANFETEIIVDESDAVKSLGKVDEAWDELGETTEKTAKKTTKSTKKMTIGTKAFSRGVKKAGETSKKAFKSISTGARATAKAVKSVTSAMTGPVGMIASLVGVGVAVSALHKILKEGREILQLSINTGIAVESLDQLYNIVQLNGAEFEDFRDGLADFTERMADARDGNKGLAESFRSLGIDLNGSVDQGLTKALRSLSSMTSESERLFRGIEVLGEDFKKTFSVTVGQGLSEFNKRMEEAADLSIFNKKFAQQLTFMGELVKKATLKIKKFFSGILEGGGLEVLGGTLEWVTGLFGETGDAISENGRKVGQSFKTLVVEKVIPAMKVLGAGILTVGKSIAIFANEIKSLFTPITVEGEKIIPVFERISLSIRKDFLNMFLDMNTGFGEMLIDFAGGLSRLNPIKNTLIELGEALTPTDESLSKTRDQIAIIDEKIALIDNLSSTESNNAVTTAKWETAINSLSGAFDDLSVSIENFTTKATEESPFSGLSGVFQEGLLGSFDEGKALNDAFAFINGIQARAGLYIEQLPPLNIFQKLFGVGGTDVVSGLLSAGAEIANATGSVMSSIFDRRNAAREQELEREQNSLNKSLSNNRLSDRARENLMRKSEAKQEKIRRKGFEQQKKQDKASTVLNIASGIAGAWSGALQTKPLSAGIALGLSTSALMGIVGGAQIKTINAQKFTNGGVAEGTSNQKSGDTIPALMNTDELALNTKQQANLLFKMANERPEQAPAVPSIVLNIMGNVVRGMEKEIENTLVNLQSQGRLRVVGLG